MRNFPIRLTLALSLLFISSVAIAQTRLLARDFVTLDGIRDVTVNSTGYCSQLKIGGGGGTIYWETRGTSTTDQAGFFQYSCKSVSPVGACNPSFDICSITSFQKTGYTFFNAGFPLGSFVQYYGTTLPTVALVSAASFQSGASPFSQTIDLTVTTNYERPQQTPSNSIISMFGANLSAVSVAANTSALPMTLGGVSIVFHDQNRVEKTASLLFVSPNQINFIVPEGLKEGPVVLRLVRGNAITHIGFAAIPKTFPSLFSANANGQGVAAAYALAVKPDESRRMVPILRYDETQKRYVPQPLEFGSADERMFLILYGTGFRNQTDMSKLQVTVGGTAGTVTYAGSQLELPGLDQINVILPRSLAGRGEANIVLKIENAEANTLTMAFK